MRRISVMDGLTVRFPHRAPELTEGFEIGCLAVALAANPARHLATVSAAAAEQAQDLARAMGYRPVTGRVGEDGVELTLLRADIRPRLALAAVDGRSLPVRCAR